MAEPNLLWLLDIVALGTVADVVALKGLNRAFVAQGLKVMANRRNVGLAALMDAARLTKPPSATDLGFALGPRINAAGPGGKSDVGVGRSDELRVREKCVSRCRSRWTPNKCK